MAELGARTPDRIRSMATVPDRAGPVGLFSVRWSGLAKIKSTCGQRAGACLHVGPGRGLAVVTGLGLGRWFAAHVPGIPANQGPHSRIVASLTTVMRVDATILQHAARVTMSLMARATAHSAATARRGKTLASPEEGWPAKRVLIRSVVGFAPVRAGLNVFLGGKA